MHILTDDELEEIKAQAFIDGLNKGLQIGRCFGALDKPIAKEAQNG